MTSVSVRASSFCIFVCASSPALFGLLLKQNEDDNDGQSEEEDSDFDPGDGEGDAESASEEEAEAEGVQGGGGASEDEDEAEWEEEASSSEGEETEYTSTATTSRYLHSHSYRSGSSAGVGGGRSAGATALIPSTGRTRKGGTRDQSARATPMGFETVERGRRRRPYGLTSAAPFTAPLSAHQSDSGLPALRGKGGRVGVLSSSRPPSEAPASSSLTRHHSGVGCREGGGEGGVDAEEMEDSGEAGMEHQDRGARGEMHPNPPTNVPLLNAQTIFPMDPPSPVLPSLQPVGLRGVKRKKADDKEGGGEGIEEGEGEGVKKEEIPPEGPECDALSDSHTRDPREHTTQSPHKGQLAAGPVSDQIPFPFLRRSPRVSSGGREGQTNRGGEERNRKSRKVNNSRGELAEERTATPFPRAAAAAAAAAAGGISLSSSVVPSISFPSVSERRAFRGRSRTANCPSGPTGVDTAAASRSAWVVQRDLLEGEGEEDEDGDDSDFDFDCADDSEEEEGSDGLEDEEEGWGGIGTGERGLMRTRLLHGELGAFGGGEAEMEEEEDFGVGEFEEDFGEELSLLLADAEAHGEGDFLFASVGGRGEDSVAGRTRRASREMGGPSSSSSSSSSSASSSSSSSSSSSVSSSSSSSSSASSSSSSSSSSFSSSSSSSSSSSAAAAVLEPSSHSPTAPLPPLESSQKTPLTAVGQVADSPAPPGTDGGRGCKGSLRGTADPLTECLWEKPQPHEAARGTAPAPSPPAPPPSQALSGVSTSGPASPSPEGLTHQAHPQQNEGVTGEPTAAAAAKQMDESMFDGSREA
uniref:REJ domain-containing protein n=1 Tax=Chromera velia CCMP2878 TaxID=1169474 RepID=A0A0K6S6W4_9ALVE|eukprot:Cvel_18099.t1-p1 / transcript=Cvel_18099.t1 / gene=Cvel_18099 / organism=Chromera_velia_CCMP2878 / gene_product=hypothetical protein / transcript_product=hypothetical protein / location=Cvel_scaffold1483:36436-38865(-) / protein_length=810 / sequence_SO=supercontig / SO=protein_coding / is_pseudo=false